MKISLHICLLFLSPAWAIGQNLSLTKTAVEISADARKKGMFVSSTLDEQGNMLSYIAYDLKKNQFGFDVITVDKNGSLRGVTSQLQQAGADPGYEIDIPQAGAVADPAKGKSFLRLITDNSVLGQMKIETGKLEPRYRTNDDQLGYVITYTPVLRGFRFVPGKPVDSVNKINIFATHSTAENNVEANYNIIQELLPNTVAYLPADGEVAFLGKNPQPKKKSSNAHNVITTGLFDGKTKSFRQLKEHVLEYNLGPVTTAYSASGNRVVLTSTFNIPSTNDDHKKWQISDIPYMSYLSFNTSGAMVDQITFKVSAVRGNFCVVPGKSVDYVVGSIDGDHKGYYQADVSKPTLLEIIKIENGGVSVQRTFDMETIAKSLLKMPGGKKGKLTYKNLVFEGSYLLKNGDLLLFAAAEDNNIVFQFSNDAQLKATYATGRLPGKDFNRSGVQVVENNEEIYILYREQAPGMARGWVKNIQGIGATKKVTFDRADELFTFGRIVKINTTQLSCSLPVDITEHVILGESPFFQGTAGSLLMLLRDSKDNYSIGKLE